MKTNEQLSNTTFVQDSVATTTKGRTTTDATTQVATLAAVGDPVAVQAQVGGRIFMSIQYLNITYSEEVRSVLYQTAPTPGTGDPIYVPSISEKTKSGVTERELPDNFGKFGLSSSFVLNFWKKMILLVMIFGILFFIFSVEIAIEKWQVKRIPLPMVILFFGRLYFLLHSTISNYKIQEHI